MSMDNQRLFSFMYTRKQVGVQLFVISFNKNTNSSVTKNYGNLGETCQKGTQNFVQALLFKK